MVLLRRYPESINKQINIKIQNNLIINIKTAHNNKIKIILTPYPQNLILQSLIKTSLTLHNAITYEITLNSIHKR